MRGAVLYKMGLNLVKERLMRRHYGVVYNRYGFNEGSDPEGLRGFDINGELLCRDVMEWYTQKVFHTRFTSNELNHRVK